MTRRRKAEWKSQGERCRTPCVGYPTPWQSSHKLKPYKCYHAKISPHILSCARQTNTHGHFCYQQPVCIGRKGRRGGGGSIASVALWERGKQGFERGDLTDRKPVLLGSPLPPCRRQLCLVSAPLQPKPQCPKLQREGKQHQGAYEVHSLHEYSVENYPREPLSRQCAKEWLKNQLRLVWVFVMCQRSEGWFRNAHYL